MSGAARTSEEARERCSEITTELLMGLTTPGERHKQHHLEQALRLLAGDEFTDKAFREFNIERLNPMDPAQR